MSKPAAPDAPRRRRGDCPLCGKPVSAAASPFCGPGCRDRDLLNWLGDGYRVPGNPLDDDQRDAPRAVGGLDSDG